MGLTATAERHDGTHDHDVADDGPSRILLVTPHGRVVTGSAALAQAVAGLIASLDGQRRASPRDLLEAVRMPLDEVL